MNNESIGTCKNYRQLYILIKTIFKKIFERIFNRWTNWEFVESWGVESKGKLVETFDLYRKENKFNKSVKYKRVYK